MAKIVLGKRPKNFKREIAVLLHDGGEGTIGMQYIHRTRSEYGDLADAEAKLAKAEAEAAIERAADEAAVPDVLDGGLAKILRRGTVANVDFVMKLADGWDLDVPFNRDAVLQLADELPHAVLAIIENYRLACTEGRLGN